MDDGWYRVDERNARVTLTVHVQPNARTTEVSGLHGDALKIRVAAPAVDNKANAVLLDFLRATLGVSAAMLSIRHGERGRHKIIEVRGADAALCARLAQLVR
jgi:uncharacterized protein